jgi:diacylglycerol kinase (ATP)
MSVTGPVRFVINPVSGLGKKKWLEKEIPFRMKERGIEFEIVYTTHAGHATDLAKKAAEEKIGVLAIAGGDGSVHEAAIALAGTETALAIIPAGSGNGIARHFGIETDPMEAIKEFPDYKIFEADTWNLNGKFFLGFAGCGFDATIAHAFAKIDKRGFRGYMKLVLQEMRKFNPPVLKINSGDSVSEEKIFVASFCSVNQYGNNIFIDANARATDGIISLNIVTPFPFYKFPRILYKSSRKGLHKSSYYKKTEGERIVLFSMDELPLHLDGEPAGTVQGEIVVEKNSQTLKLLGRQDGV